MYVVWISFIQLSLACIVTTVNPLIIIILDHRDEIIMTKLFLSLSGV